MESRRECFCWKIMQCKSPENCSAKKNTEKPCWEIASVLNSDMHILNVCRDCIVRLVKENNPLLSNKELFEIMKIRVEKSLAIRLFENL